MKNNLIKIHVRSQHVRPDGTYNVDYIDTLPVTAHESILEIIQTQTRNNRIVSIISDSESFSSFTKDKSIYGM